MAEKSTASVPSEQVDAERAAKPLNPRTSSGPYPELGARRFRGVCVYFKMEAQAGFVRHLPTKENYCFYSNSLIMQEPDEPRMLLLKEWVDFEIDLESGEAILITKPGGLPIHHELHETPNLLSTIKGEKSSGDGKSTGDGNEGDSSLDESESRPKGHKPPKLKSKNFNRKVSAMYIEEDVEDGWVNVHYVPRISNVTRRRLASHQIKRTVRIPGITLKCPPKNVKTGTKCKEALSETSSAGHASSQKASQASTSKPGRTSHQYGPTTLFDPSYPPPLMGQASSFGPHPPFDLPPQFGPPSQYVRTPHYDPTSRPAPHDKVFRNERKRQTRAGRDPWSQSDETQNIRFYVSRQEFDISQNRPAEPTALQPIYGTVTYQEWSEMDPGNDKHGRPPISDFDGSKRTTRKEEGSRSFGVHRPSDDRRRTRQAPQVHQAKSTSEDQRTYYATSDPSASWKPSSADESHEHFPVPQQTTSCPHAKTASSVSRKHPDAHQILVPAPQQTPLSRGDDEIFPKKSPASTKKSVSAPQQTTLSTNEPSASKKSSRKSLTHPPQQQTMQSQVPKEPPPSKKLPVAHKSPACASRQISQSYVTSEPPHLSKPPTTHKSVAPASQQTTLRYNEPPASIKPPVVQKHSVQASQQTPQSHVTDKILTPLSKKTPVSSRDYVPVDQQKMPPPHTTVEPSGSQKPPLTHKITDHVPAPLQTKSLSSLAKEPLASKKPSVTHQSPASQRTPMHIQTTSKPPGYQKPSFSHKSPNFVPVSQQTTVHSHFNPRFTSPLTTYAHKNFVSDPPTAQRTPTVNTQSQNVSNRESACSRASTAGSSSSTLTQLDTHFFSQPPPARYPQSRPKVATHSTSQQPSDLVTTGYFFRGNFKKAFQEIRNQGPKLSGYMDRCPLSAQGGGVHQRNPEQITSCSAEHLRTVHSVRDDISPASQQRIPSQSFVHSGHRDASNIESSVGLYQPDGNYGHLQYAPRSSVTTTRPADRSNPIQERYRVEAPQCFSFQSNIVRTRDNQLVRHADASQAMNFATAATSRFVLQTEQPTRYATASGRENLDFSLLPRSSIQAVSINPLPSSDCSVRKKYEACHHSGSGRDGAQTMIGQQQQMHPLSGTVQVPVEPLSVAVPDDIMYAMPLQQTSQHVCSTDHTIYGSASHYDYINPSPQPGAMTPNTALYHARVPSENISIGAISGSEMVQPVITSPSTYVVPYAQPAGHVVNQPQLIVSPVARYTPVDFASPGISYARDLYIDNRPVTTTVVSLLPGQSPGLYTGHNYQQTAYVSPVSSVTSAYQTYWPPGRSTVQTISNSPPPTTQVQVSNYASRMLPYILRSQDCRHADRNFPPTHVQGSWAENRHLPRTYSRESIVFGIHDYDTDSLRSGASSPAMFYTGPVRSDIGYPGAGRPRDMSVCLPQTEEAAVMLPEIRLLEPAVVAAEVAAHEATIEMATAVGEAAIQDYSEEYYQHHFY